MRFINPYNAYGVAPTTATFAPQVGGFAGTQPLTAAQKDFLRKRACEFVQLLANSPWMSGFSSTEENRLWVGLMAATALFGYWLSPNHDEWQLYPQYQAAAYYVRDNLHTQGFCGPKTPPLPGLPARR